MSWFVVPPLFYYRPPPFPLPTVPWLRHLALHAAVAVTRLAHRTVLGVSDRRRSSDLTRDPTHELALLVLIPRFETPDDA